MTGVPSKNQFPESTPSMSKSIFPPRGSTVLGFFPYNFSCTSGETVNVTSLVMTLTTLSLSHDQKKSKKMKNTNKAYF